jgi:hypothetical protein
LESTVDGGSGLGVGVDDGHAQPVKITDQQIATETMIPSLFIA